MPAETPLERLRRIVGELEERRLRVDDVRVLAGRAPLLPSDTIAQVRARVAKRSGRPVLTLVKGGRDDG